MHVQVSPHSFPVNMFRYLYIDFNVSYKRDPHQPAGVMKELHMAVKWGLEDVSASHNLQERTVISVLKDTITTLSAFVSFFLCLNLMLLECCMGLCTRFYAHAAVLTNCYGTFHTFI